MRSNIHTQPVPTPTHIAAKPSAKPMRPAAAMKLVDLLATDDAFRKAFMADARPALEAWGFEDADVSDFWFDCKMGISELAPKEVIAAAREEILSMLTSILAQTTPRLDSGLDSSRRLKL